MRTASIDRIRTRLACIVLAVGLLACEERVASPRPQPAEIASPGQVLYLTNCESCHGVAGTGNGPASASLRTPAADLSQLWKRYGTPLDRERLAEYIDGRKRMAFQEAREMPIWGEEFFENAPADTPNLEIVRARLIAVLAEYLETLQTEQSP